MIIAFAVCPSMTWLACPYSKVGDLIAKCEGKEEGARAVKSTIIGATFDILSDILIASLPICLLWRAKVSRRQKVGLSMTLSLSFAMAIVALIRTIGFHLSGGEIDLVWLVFWQQNECNIAVWMFSITAFRSFFVTSRSNGGEYALFPPWLGRLCSRARRKLSSIFPKVFGQDGSGNLPYYLFASDQSTRPIIRTNDVTIPQPTLQTARSAINRAGSTDSYDMVTVQEHELLVSQRKAPERFGV